MGFAEDGFTEDGAGMIEITESELTELRDKLHQGGPMIIDVETVHEALTYVNRADDTHDAIAALDRLDTRIATLTRELAKYEGGWCTKCGQTFERSCQEAATDDR